jgi:hypothetical protein
MTDTQVVDKSESTESGHDLFEVWKEYEKTAMHFNGLLIQLRMRSLGGIAAITALFGFLARGSETGQFQWGTLAAVFVILTIAWVAIACLDLLYYDRLLRGAVAAIFKIEDLSEDSTTIRHIEMSHIIEAYCRGLHPEKVREGFLSGRRWFYGLVLFALVVSLYFTLAQHCLLAGPSALVHTHSVCAVISHWGD